MVEPKPVSIRTKLLLAGYVVSGALGLLMALWIAVTALIALPGHGFHIGAFATALLFPWLPSAVAFMFVAKAALRWSNRRDESSGVNVR